MEIETEAVGIVFFLSEQGSTLLHPVLRECGHSLARPVGVDQ